MLKQTALAAAFMITSAAMAVEDIDGSLAKIEGQDRAALLDRMERVLFDGPSSRLRDVRKIDKTRLCGLVNPKNRMGAYIGYRPFLFDIEFTELVLGGEDADAHSKGLTEAACR